MVVLSLLSLGWFFLADPLGADVEFSLLIFAFFGEWKTVISFFQEIFCISLPTKKDWKEMRRKKTNRSHSRSYWIELQF